MLPSLKKTSEQLKFYEFRGSDELINVPVSEGRNRPNNKFS